MNDEHISAEKLYKILHYSKRKTKYLLDNGVIPCENSGKKTRCYRVKMSDVELYLENIRRDPKQYFFPAGIFSSNCKHVPAYKIELSVGEHQRLYGIINRALSTTPDALTVDDAAATVGYSRTLILKTIQSGDLYAEKVLGKTIIPKEKLIRFLAEKSGMAIKYKSAFHKKMLQILIERENSKCKR